MNKNSVNHQITTPISPAGMSIEQETMGSNGAIIKQLTLNKRVWSNWRDSMKKLRQTIFGILIVTGLLLAGSEATTIQLRLVGNTSGLILFVIGGYCFAGECRKA